MDREKRDKSRSHISHCGDPLPSSQRQCDAEEERDE